jgi:uncharacterized paraquat-inducible protein A
MQGNRVRIDMSEPDEQHESEHECQGCGMQFNGFGTLSHHTARCQRALLLDSDDARELDEVSE